MIGPTGVIVGCLEGALTRFHFGGAALLLTTFLSVQAQ
jgi:hypothetical protein